MPYGPLEIKFFRQTLRPGDVLLFDRKGFFDWVIRHATNANVTHTECWLGGIPAKTAACRNGIGVNIFDPEFDGLIAILRPKTPFDLVKATAFQRSAIGEKYDWTGLVRAFVGNQWGRNNDKEWCSENTTLVQRAGGVEPFTEDVPGDMVAPGDFFKSAAYDHVWKAKGY